MPHGVDLCAAVRESEYLGEWLMSPGFGVYVHIPFCLHRCHYCDFNTYEGQQQMYAGYVDALVADIERWSGRVAPATSVFFGGGTPTLLATSELGRILDAIKHRIGIAAGAEVTIEANPETVDAAKFTTLLECGFNRVSIGVQSLEPRVLLGLGRTHSAGRALEALADARLAGVENLNADLIYGSPWERDDDWERSLEGVVDAGVDHVSTYALTVEEGTPLHTLVAAGKAPDVDADLQADRAGMCRPILQAAGFAPYEISNWARPGKASRHNVLYWSGGDYLGFGAGAHAHLGGRRWWSHKLPREFVKAVQERRSTTAGGESLSLRDRAAEALMLGLRLTSGVDLYGFTRRFGEAHLADLLEPLAELEALELVERVDGRLKLTERGAMLANEVLCRLL